MNHFCSGSVYRSSLEVQVFKITTHLPVYWNYCK